MPKKNDDFDAITAGVVSAHLGNVTAEYQPNTDEQVSVQGIFQNEFVETNDIVGTAPVFTCDLSVIPGVSKGHKFLINNSTYSIRVPEKDGAGMVRCILKKV